MAGLFEIFNRMTDDDIRIQIAFLKNITLANVAKETGNKMLGGFAGFANSITEAFSGKTPFAYQAKNVSDMVNDDYERMAVNDRIQLDYELKRLLLQKCIELNPSVNKEGNISDDRLIFLVVNEAAKVYPSIEKYAGCANKMQQIHIEYNKAFINSLHIYLQKQQQEDIKRMDNQIQMRLNEVSMDTKRELQKALLPKEFSGRGIGRILRLEKGTKYLTRTVECLGIDCFDMVNVNIETALVAVRSLKRISRLLFAEFIWRATASSLEKFTIDRTILPSYVQTDMMMEHLEQEKKLRVLLSDRIEAENRLNKSEKELEKIEAQIQDNTDRLELEQREYDEIQMSFMGLESKKDEYISGKHTDSETKSYYNQVNETKRKLDSAKNDWAKRQQKLKELVNIKNRIESERNTARLNFEVVKSKSDKQVSEKAQKLKSQWEAFFYKLSIDSDIIEKLVIEFTDAEIIKIEEFLKEMQDNGDMSSFAYETQQIENKDIVFGENINDIDNVNDTQLESDNADSMFENNSDTYNDDTIKAENQDKLQGLISDIYSENMVTYCNVAAGKNVRIVYKDNEIISIERK